MSSNRLKAFTVLALLMGVVALVVVFLPRGGSNIPSETPSIPAEPASQPHRDGIAKPGVLVQKKTEPAPRATRKEIASAPANRARTLTFTGNETPIRESAPASESVETALVGAPTVRTYRPASEVVTAIDADAIATGRVSLASAPVPMMGMIPQPSTAMSVPGAGTAPAPEGVLATPSLSREPAVLAEPAFCPIGTVEKTAKAKVGGKERFCSRPDKGGILFREGPYLAFHANGKKRAEGVYAAGRMGGAWTEWYDTGRKAGEGTYAGGKRSGNWVFYWESGRGKSSEGLFRGGLKNGRWIFYDDRARKESEGELKTVDNVERKTGRWTYWHPNGKRRAEGVYRDGRREGKWTEWSAKGTVASIDVYRDGEKE